MTAVEMRNGSIDFFVDGIPVIGLFEVESTELPLELDDAGCPVENTLRSVSHKMFYSSNHQKAGEPSINEFE